MLPSEMSEPVRQHIAPIKAHLIHFADENSKLSAIRKETRAVSTRSLNKSAVERNFYTLPEGVLADRFAAEKDLAIFENAARPIINRLAAAAQDCATRMRGGGSTDFRAILDSERPRFKGQYRRPVRTIAGCAARIRPLSQWFGAANRAGGVHRRRRQRRSYG
ncbi:MAG TPA: DUF4238 domain-containing protein, partial [Thermoleophilaceae bacterium]|nr:DUF4238 domain-containing protein [Thermoleophilaceae bacterium]